MLSMSTSDARKRREEQAIMGEGCCSAAENSCTCQPGGGCGCGKHPVDVAIESD